MKNKGMKKIERIFNKLNKVNIDLDSAIKFNAKETEKEEFKILKVEDKLRKQKAIAEAKKALAANSMELLQLASEKATILLSNLTKIMSGDITVSDVDVETIDKVVTEIDD